MIILPAVAVLSCCTTEQKTTSTARVFAVEKDAAVVSTRLMRGGAPDPTSATHVAIWSRSPDAAGGPGGGRAPVRWMHGVGSHK